MRFWQACRSVCSSWCVPAWSTGAKFCHNGTKNNMTIKQFIRQLEQCQPDALVMVQTIDDNGNIQMVEAKIIKDIRSGDAEVYPAE